MSKGVKMENFIDLYELILKFTKEYGLYFLVVITLIKVIKRVVIASIIGVVVFIVFHSDFLNILALLKGQ